MSDEIDNAAGYFQKPTFNARERLVCSHLIEGINAQPLDTILHTCSAALLLDDETLGNLEIDRNLVLSIFKVAQLLQSAKPIQSSDKWGDIHITIHTTTLDYEEDVRQWAKLRYYPHYRNRETEQTEYTQNMQQISDNEAFNTANRKLSLDGFHLLSSDFINYATPIIQQVGGKLAGIVSPESYIELFKLIKGETP